MELAAADTLPVFPSPSGNLLFLDHATESLHDRLTISVPQDQAHRVRSLTVKDLRQVIGEPSYVLVPSK